MPHPPSHPLHPLSLSYLPAPLSLPTHVSLLAIRTNGILLMSVGCLIVLTGLLTHTTSLVTAGAAVVVGCVVCMGAESTGWHSLAQGLIIALGAGVYMSATLLLGWQSGAQHGIFVFIILCGATVDVRNAETAAAVVASVCTMWWWLLWVDCPPEWQTIIPPEVRETVSIILQPAMAIGLLLYNCLMRKHMCNGMRDLLWQVGQERLTLHAVLHELVPQSIAERLLQGDQLVADTCPQASVAFATVSNFMDTHEGPHSAHSKMDELADILARFDSVIEQFPRVQKIKTVGCGVMLATALEGYSQLKQSSKTPLNWRQQLHELVSCVAELHAQEGRMRGAGRVLLRSGVHTGELVAGVISTRRAAFDIYGDCVNTASRMMSTGVPGHIQVSVQVVDALSKLLTPSRLEPLVEVRRDVTIKGKGTMDTFLIDPAQALVRAAFGIDNVIQASEAGCTDDGSRSSLRTSSQRKLSRNVIAHVVGEGQQGGADTEVLLFRTQLLVYFTRTFAGFTVGLLVMIGMFVPQGDARTKLMAVFCTGAAAAGTCLALLRIGYIRAARALFIVDMYAVVLAGAFVAGSSSGMEFLVFALPLLGTLFPIYHTVLFALDVSVILAIWAVIHYGAPTGSAIPAMYTFLTTSVLMMVMTFVRFIGVTNVVVHGTLRKHRESTTALLFELVPEDVVQRMHQGERKIADLHFNASVLVVDIVGYTSLSASMSARSLLNVLRVTFSKLDQMVAGYPGITKIKSVGDAYVLAAGLGQHHNTDPVEGMRNLVRLALALQTSRVAMPDETGDAGGEHVLRFRVGIHAGPVVGGVVSSTGRFAYDLFGDTMRIAEALEAAASPGKVLVSRQVAEAIGNDEEFCCLPFLKEDPVQPGSDSDPIDEDEELPPMDVPLPRKKSASNPGDLEGAMFVTGRPGTRGTKGGWSIGSLDVEQGMRDP